MNTTTRLRRRSLPGGVALALATSRAGGDPWGQAAASAPPGGEEPQARPSKGDGKDRGRERDKDKPPARLVVRVRGDGKPVVHADVKVKVGGGDGISLVTNERGEASLTRNAAGPAEVHVIAPGWVSGRGVVELKAGEPTSLSIELKKQ